MKELPHTNGHDAQTMDLHIIRCVGVVVPSPPLELQPFRVVRFGSPEAPLTREFVDLRELDALLTALRPAVHTVCSYGGGSPVPEVQEAIRILRGVFEAPPVEAPAAPALVTA